MSVEENTAGTFEHNKSLLKKALLAATCRQQSEEGSQQEQDSMPDSRCQNVSSSQLKRKPASITQNKLQIQLLEYKGVHDFRVHLPINKVELIETLEVMFTPFIFR